MTEAAPRVGSPRPAEPTPAEPSLTVPSLTVPSPAGAVVTVCPDGPLLIRGDFAVVDAAGAPIPGARRTTALCRCGRSSTKPFCDGSHKTAGFRAS